MIVTELLVPPMPCVAAEGVFDAVVWCASDTVEWRRPTETLETSTRVDGTNPPGLLFVMRADHTFLPRELARLHAPGWGLVDENALAPYAIDDATDLLYERRVRPRDVFWLGASTLEALVWGLHDWVHFHCHGPFTEPAATELQCDLVALHWLRTNRSRIGIDDAICDRVAGELCALARRRFAGEGKRPPMNDLDRLFAGGYPTMRTAPSRTA